jgi:hypothetical protein
VDIHTFTVYDLRTSVSLNSHQSWTYVQFLKKKLCLLSLGDLGDSPGHLGIPEFVISLYHYVKSLKTSKSQKIS